MITPVISSVLYTPIQVIYSGNVYGNHFSSYVLNREYLIVQLIYQRGCGLSLIAL